MSTETQFEEAALNVKKLTSRPGNDQLLKLYALYKQGSEGDLHGDKPGMFDFKGQAKWNAWEKLKGTEQEDAKAQYVTFVNELLAG